MLTLKLKAINFSFSTWKGRYFADYITLYILWKVKFKLLP